ncbi:MAG TPA: hypothetical protein VFW98_09415 [Gemmatimonadaceae bacterium]|nr:hypothetical protein [Gemmatimonadaceae bacterium]
MKNLMRRTRRVIAPAAVVAGILAMSACGLKDRLLEPQTPQVISPSNVQNADGADALYVGAIGDLADALNGGNNNQEQLWEWEGLMTDEFKSGDTFSQRNDDDQRVTVSNDGVMRRVYQHQQQSRGRARDAINALTEFEPDAHAKIAEMYLMMGFLEMSLSQDWCNGVPYGETVDGVPQYTNPLTNADGFKLAIARFDTALTLLGSASDKQSTSVRNAVLIAKGRAQVDLGQFSAAAATVAPVPVDYQYLLTYSIPTNSNEWWEMQPNTLRYTVGDSVDKTGIVKNSIPFASANDPRVPILVGKESVGESDVSFDGKTPYFESELYTGREDPIPMVSGLDGQLVQAEADLNKPDIPAMMKILNDLRATPPMLGNYQPAAMAPLATPATQDAAVSLFFREKAFWQFERGERLSDMRRLMRQYGRTEDEVFPTGPFFKNGAYGHNVNIPIPDREQNNPNFKGCMDRKA